MAHSTLCVTIFYRFPLHHWPLIMTVGIYHNHNTMSDREMMQEHNERVMRFHFNIGPPLGPSHLSVICDITTGCCFLGWCLSMGWLGPLPLNFFFFYNTSSKFLWLGTNVDNKVIPQLNLIPTCFTPACKICHIT